MLAVGIEQESRSGFDDRQESELTDALSQRRVVGRTGRRVMHIERETDRSEPGARDADEGVVEAVVGETVGVVTVEEAQSRVESSLSGFAYFVQRLTFDSYLER